MEKMTFNKLVALKNAFELLGEERMLSLDDCPMYWEVLNEIDSIFKENYVL